MLEYIKSDKHMTMSHWRYQLLHWVFCIPEEDRTVKNSPLPQFLYTHYCPIFHLTNLLLLISPFIMLYRLTKAFVLFFSPVWTCTKLVHTKIWSAFDKLTEYRRAAKKERWEEYKKTKEYVVNIVKNNLENGYHYTFENYKHLNITEKEFQQLVMDYTNRRKNLAEKEKERTQAAAELLEKKRAAWQKRITFWVNFSRPLIKGLLNLLYACIFLLSAYVVVLITPPIISGILWCVYWLFSISFYEVFLWLWMGIKLLLIAVAMIITATTLWRYAPQKQIKNTLGVPCNIFLNAINSFAEWLIDKALDTKEFVKMFYEENCPPVIIDEE